MQRGIALDKAKEAVAARRSSYGTPEDNFKRIAALWNAHLDNAETNVITTADVAIMLGLVKVARLESNPNHADSWIDLAGYAGCGAEVSGAELAPQTKFGFTVGERVNSLRSFSGDNAGTVVGFEDNRVRVKWDEFYHVACPLPTHLRHGE